MAIDQNSSQINSFSKGMNSDTALDVVQSEAYVFGQNIRITNNALLSALIDSNSTEGIVTPVNSGIQYSVVWKEGANSGKHDYTISSILATASIGNIGAIVVKDTAAKWHIIKVGLDEQQKKFVLNNVFDSTSTTDKDRFSVVINRELKNVIKLYLADGIHEIMELNIDDSNLEYLLNNEDYLLTEDELISNHIFPTKKIQILKQISGTLKTQQVQYTYRYYNKYGISSKLAPITNKLQIIDSNRNKETGNAENTTTSVGLQLNIPETRYLQRVFDHIQVFRISYIVATQTPEIALIYDAAIDPSAKNFTLNDTGIKSLQDLSIDEFNSMSGQSIVPQVIEQNQNYMFAANTVDKTTIIIDKTQYDARSFSFNTNGSTTLYKDGAYESSASYTTSDIPDTSITSTYYLNKYADINLGGDLNTNENFAYDKQGYYGGSGQNVSWRFVVTPIELHSDCIKRQGSNNLSTPQIDTYSSPNTPTTYQNADMYYITKNGTLDKANKPSTTDGYFEQHDIFTVSSLSYNDITTSSLLRSLKRDDVYRYGVVFYDKRGTRSDVLWIADIRTPNIKTVPITTYASSIDKIQLTPSQSDDPNEEKTLYALSLGIRFNVKKPQNLNSEEIIGYQIVRCEKTTNTTRNILQVATAKPVHQYMWGFEEDEIFSPYYPSGFITTQDLSIVSYAQHEQDKIFGIPFVDGIGYATIAGKGSGQGVGGYLTSKAAGTYRGYNETDQTLLQLYSADILFYRDDITSLLSQIDLKLLPLYYSYGETLSQINTLIERSYIPHASGADDDSASIQPATETTTTIGSPPWATTETSTTSITTYDYRSVWEKFLHYGTYTDLPDKEYINVARNATSSTTGDKSSAHLTLHNYFNKHIVYDAQKQQMILGGTSQESPYVTAIKEVADVKNPTWEEGFSNLQFDGSEIKGGVKQYKSFVSSIGSDSYVNWVSSGMYDLKIGKESQLVTSKTGDGGWGPEPAAFTWATADRSPVAWGWIGPGPVCLLCQIDKNVIKPFSGLLRITAPSQQATNWFPNEIGTIIANIQHTAVQFAGLTEQEHQYDVYYGFGDFQTFDDNIQDLIVYNGDIYITPCEFAGMYKAYDFNSLKDTLVSNQIIYYIPLETKVNTFFDYGMNYRNTGSTNLQLEPGRISGVSSQDRPMHQYNSVYSDNNTSNDVFISQPEERNPTDFPQRIMYSQLKTNGESIDSWQIYKAANYIDVDSRYGELTNLLTAKDIIYYWQNTAFGKLSVNERSLVSDQNNNTIQLGQAGVLQRNDYIDTKYGMREQDFSALSAENGIYWIDILNKAVVSYGNGVCSNYSETRNIQNIINEFITEQYRPAIHYDLQNEELLCSFLKIDKNHFSDKKEQTIDQRAQIVFNLKFGMATAVYTREYEDAILFNNVLYGLYLSNEGNLQFTKYNYITAQENNNKYLSPTIVSFVVNKNPSNAKVFDNQKFVTAKRNTVNEYDETFVKTFLKDKYYTFTTDINKSTIGKINNIDVITDREGNIVYPIPRYNDQLNGVDEYGQRLRGKWMRVDIRDDNPTYNHALSHILTKFRQSYS